MACAYTGDQFNLILKFVKTPDHLLLPQAHAHMKIESIVLITKDSMTICWFKTIEAS